MSGVPTIVIRPCSIGPKSILPHPLVVLRVASLISTMHFLYETCLNGVAEKVKTYTPHKHAGMLMNTVAVWGAPYLLLIFDI